ncbi:D-alanyl-D-alanine carboxypeptidase [Flavimobilis marinus]|uniref:D-alanyl-D-alanine carboxypeptidase / D-alanyl-D-alanine-endopeptidase (Penicillin-binding protein 4) n=1 Tax=Flavimobilis marinus TaxID=285351 RepID=A0A1I2GXN0_9MICO|nr:D-alanyl-D-alanine carboxypeptidase [Flavimobilis marinus]SFF21356.1 D-alanyl-D-alanine carboxypeptidase / D-alanyl-D-alanine-endopeptidase (penicillin-binding protein 4) [Flavimobilis marinus]
MGLAARVAGVTVTFALLAGGGYVAGDIYDVVPGFLTNAPVPEPPAPFPTAPAATLGGEITSTATLLDPGAPVPAPDQLAELVQSLVEEEDLVGPSVGVLVTDALTGQELVAHEPDAPQVPASTVKLLTGVAALTTLGTERTLDTRVVQATAGEVVLVGGGDMMLAPGAGDPTSVTARAGLGDLAAQVADALAARGQAEVTVRVDDSLFTGPAVSETWLDANVRLGYVAPVTALAVDVARTEDGQYVPRFADPSIAAAEVFAQALAESGVSVVGDVARLVVEGEPEVLGSVSSAPLGEIVDYTLKTSDNTVAEVLGRLVALEAGLPGSFDGATAAVLAAVGRTGVDVSRTTLADCSGLGDGSRIPPRALVQTLQRASSAEHPVLRRAIVGMPVAGLSGTLYDRFLESPARGLLRAKTGSLPRTTGLTGSIVTADGRQLYFAVMVDRAPEGGAWGSRATVDKFVSALAACGCS